MSVDYVALGLGAGGAWAGLREICGYDEDSVSSTETMTAIQLLDRLLVNGPGTHIDPGSAVNLTASDRDRLLASVYMRTYGPCIESTVRCEHCGDPFDLDFSLHELVDGLRDMDRTAAVEKEPAGVFKLPDGRRFRLPTGEDEYAVWHLPPDKAESELLARCVVEGDPTVEPEAVQAAMREVGPVLDLDLDARCPECGEIQIVHFDIQSYLLTALKSERKQLSQEVHRLATAYGWSLPDILGLARSQRRTYVALIEAEAPRPQRWYG
jgi:hypothetical protein